MSQLKHYYRPQSVAEALQLLAEPAVTILAGGTRLVPQVGSWETVVDLQAIGINKISAADQTVSYGAMVRLQTLVDHHASPPLIREMALREGPNTLRHTATVGGTVVAADPESELYAALLVHEARITIETPAGRQTMPLAGFELPAGGLVTGVTLRTDGTTASARVARTPADKPIVAVVGRESKEETAVVTRFAMCGVAARPRLIDPEALADLNPPADFRGSSAYRQEMAATLLRRVINELQGGS